MVISLSVGQSQLQVHHFIVGLSQLKHQLSADQQVVSGVQVCRRTDRWDVNQQPEHFRVRIKGQRTGTVADRLQHVNSSLVHLAAPLQILLEEGQGPEQGAVVLQDLYVVRHIAVHLEVLLSLLITVRMDTENLLDTHFTWFCISLHAWLHCGNVMQNTWL